ncbi:MAG TPA: hypothetical protein VG253_14200 [Streptosporangiaceae bacterium]|jgi:hypothetical protein|nr:hypothetical protein [Streptosporangiaceae bacterium]
MSPSDGVLERVAFCNPELRPLVFRFRPVLLFLPAALRLPVTLRIHPAQLELPSELTLDMVHEVVQIAFAWHGYHLHQFETACGSFGRPDGDGDWALNPGSRRPRKHRQHA